MSDSADYRDSTHLDDNERQITQIVKNIRHKMYGIDVRESIAEAIERTYDDATANGNSNMEVSKARGIYVSLSERQAAQDEDRRKILERTEKLQGQVDSLTLHAGDPTHSDAEVSQARAGENVLNTRLTKIESGSRIDANAIKFDHIEKSLISAGYNYYASPPNYDQESKTLKLSAKDAVFWGGAESKNIYVLPENVELVNDLSNTSRMKLTFNIISHDFKLVKFDKTLGESDILLAIMNLNGSNPTANFPIYLNGKPQSELLEIPILFPFSAGPQICPKIDSAAKKLIFPPATSDWLFMASDGSYYSLFTSGGKEIDLSPVDSMSSTAVALLVNRSDKSLQFVGYNGMKNFVHTHMLLGSIRKTGAIYSFEGAFPCVQDGAPMGIPRSEYQTIQQLAPLHSGSVHTVNIDKSTAQIVFPSGISDVVFYAYGRAVTGAIPKDGLTLNIPSMSEINSTALILLFNMNTKEIFFDRYNAIGNYQAPAYALLGTLRRSYASSGGLAICDISLPFLWSVDGLLFNRINPSGIAIQNPTDSSIKAIAHRGFNQNSPENVAYSFKEAKRRGFNYVECDVRFTKDMIPVLLHDDTINRTARTINGAALSSSIKIADITLEEAKQYDYGYAWGEKYAGEEIPTFKEFLTLCRKLNLRPYIEIKTAPTTQHIQILIDAVAEAQMKDRVTWIGQPQYIKMLAPLSPNSRIGGLLSPITQDLINLMIRLKGEGHDTFIDTNVTSITRQLVESAVTQGVPVEIWTVNYPEPGKLDSYVEWGVSGITTDFINIAEQFLS